MVREARASRVTARGSQYTEPMANLSRASRASRVPHLVALSVTLALSVSGPSGAQQRPAIPEVACTRVTLVAVPGTGARAREVGLRIVNSDPGDFPARMHREIEVETEVGGSWRRVSVAGLMLRSSCSQQPDACVTIAPRTTLNVVPWTGMQGDGQCVCTRCAPAPAGRYRFVVRTCDDCFSPTEAVSAPFTLPPAP